MTKPHDHLYQIALTCIPNVGGVIARTLVSHCGGPEAVFHESRSRLIRIPGVGPGIAARIHDPETIRLAEMELEYCLEHDIRIYFYLDDSYPERLARYQQSPVLLYARGDLDLNPVKVVAIVGTRTPTVYGKRICRELVRDLAETGATIVSGLAYGIDIEAHQSAMQYGLQTVGVLGSGFGHIYPKAHLQKAKRMMDCGGLVTEFGFTTGPDKDNFPARNRIVAGMVDAIIVVESGERGGSMITAEFANAYHKDVFAIPGRIGDRQSAGCHRLIKSHKAHLIESASDLTSLLRWDISKERSREVQRLIFADLDEREQLVVDLLERDKETAIDVLAYAAGLPVSELATVLLSLEFKGIIRALPGKRFQIV